MATAALHVQPPAPRIEGDRYELVKARVDLLEAEAEFAQSYTVADRALARQRVEEARCRVVRWRGAT